MPLSVWVGAIAFQILYGLLDNVDGKQVCTLWVWHHTTTTTTSSSSDMILIVVCMCPALLLLFAHK